MSSAVLGTSNTAVNKTGGELALQGAYILLRETKSDKRVDSVLNSRKCRAGDWVV